MDIISLGTVPETGVALHIDQTEEGLPPDANMNGSSGKKSKRRKKKKKEEALCEEDKKLDAAENTTKEDQVRPPKNPLSNVTIQEDSYQQAQDSCEKPEDLESGAIDMASSERKKKRRKKKKKEEALCEEEKTLDAAEKATNEDQVHPPKNDLSNVTIQEDSYQQAQDSCEKPEDSQSGAIDMTSSERKKKRRKKKKDKDRNALRESGVDTSSVVTMECDAMHNSEAQGQGSKLKSTEEKNVDGTVVNGFLKPKDDTVGQENGADAKAYDTVSETQNPKAKKKKKRKTKTMEVCDALENTLATSMESGPVECIETAGVCKVKSKKQMRKRKKTSSTDQETANMEVCDPSEEICGVQNPGTCKEKTKDEDGEPKQKRRKKKKKKSCEDEKTDNMDSEKDDVSLHRNEGKLEFDGEKLDTQLSSSVLINDNVAQGVASQVSGDLPRCSCKGQSTRKLVVFDLNGILADIARGGTGGFVPDGKISLRSVFKRPFVATFLDFCFERFDVGIWSSRRIGLDYMTDIVMGNHARNLLFTFDQSICITTKFKTLENTTKPLFLKDLRTVWNRFGTCLSCGKRKYDETNTLLVDDSPDKALCNPPHTGIFPFPYQFTDREDSALGPDGELRKYMERLVDAENVQKFVEENPIGQSAITETHESWSFYSRVIKAHKQ